MMSRKKLITSLIILLFTIAPILSAVAEELVVYSARKKTLTRKPFNKFSRDTGIRIKVLEGSASELMEKIKNEGTDSPADVLLTVDAGSLWQATQQGLFHPVNSETLVQNIPAHLRDPDNHWFGLSERTRTIIYSKKRVSPSQLTTYEDLAGQKWRNRLCLRTSKKVYNQSLVAMMIAKHGAGKTEEIIKGWVRNLVDDPYDKDNDVIHAIAEGKCDVGIVNHYYLNRLLKADPGKPVGLFWPNQGENEGGVYVDISGAGVLKNSRNKGPAVTFLEYLSSEKAQDLFADSNMEYPVNPKVQPNPQVKAWGDFKPNTDNISESGKYRDAALSSMYRADYK